MNTKMEKLLEKAISTTSEEEAISCLKMARKQGTKFYVDEVKIPVKEAQDENVYATLDKYKTLYRTLHKKALEIEKQRNHVQKAYFVLYQRHEKNKKTSRNFWLFITILIGIFCFLIGLSL